MRSLILIILILVLGIGSAAYILQPDDSPNPFADGCQASSEKIATPENCAGGPDGKFVEISKGDRNHSILIDMGEGQEGTGNLMIYYKTEGDVSIAVQFAKFENDTIIPITEQLITLSKEHTENLLTYPDLPSPYRYVRVYASEERKYKLDAVRAETHRPDSDSDGLKDEYELQYGLNPLINTGLDGPDGDPDNDWLPNKKEAELELNPKSGDTDGDTLPDYWEVENKLDGTDPTGINGKGGMPDKDDLTNEQELQYGTNPQKPDTDKDGLTDSQEIFQFKTNPLREDTDGDKLPDGWEIDYLMDPNSATDPNADGDGDGLGVLDEYKNKTNPLKPDTDEDCWNDATEISQGSDPNNWDDGDCDHDTVSNGFEKDKYKTDPLNPDTDGDGLPDPWEIVYFLNPLLSMDKDGRDGDPDWDGANNLNEFIYTSDPNKIDTDGDTLPDIWEIRFCLKTTDKEGNNGPEGDPDGDGYTNFVEMGMGTDPTGCHP